MPPLGGIAYGNFPEPSARVAVPSHPSWNTDQGVQPVRECAGDKPRRVGKPIHGKSADRPMAPWPRGNFFADGGIAYRLGPERWRPMPG